MGDAADGVLARWRAHDLALAVSAEDRRAIDACEGARAAIVERSGEPSRDLFHALAVYGRALAVAGASPTLAGATIDGLARALGETPWCTAARSAVAEGFAAERADQATRAVLASWAPERCIVHVGEGCAAVVCGLPTDDAEELLAWSDGVARKLAKARVRRVVLDGRAPAALLSALDIAGIAVEPGLV
jgi:hypothetical protein